MLKRLSSYMQLLLIDFQEQFKASLSVLHTNLGRKLKGPVVLIFNALTTIAANY